MMIYHNIIRASNHIHQSVRYIFFREHLLFYFKAFFGTNANNILQYFFETTKNIVHQKKYNIFSVLYLFSGISANINIDLHKM